MDIDSLLIDPEKEDLGVWLDYGRDGKTKVKLASWSNPMAEVFRGEKARELGDKLQGPNATDQERLDAWFELETETMVRHILKDWEGFTQGGEPLEYSEEVAREILSDKRYRRFRHDMFRMSATMENYRPDADEAIEDAVKPDAAS